MFLGLLQNQQLPWPSINMEIGKIKFKGDPSYSQETAIVITTLNEKVSRGLLASNLDKLDSLEIRIHEPQSDSLLWLADTLPKLACSPRELRIILPFEGTDMKPDYQRYDQKPLKYVQAIKEAVAFFGEKLEVIVLDLANWNLAMEGISDAYIEEVISVFSTVKRLRHLMVSFFQWGFQNTAVTGKSVKIICERLSHLSPSLKELYLDLGRWGCVRHNTLNVINADHVMFLSDFLQNFTHLEQLSLNLRSWGYGNSDITGESMSYLSQALTNLKELRYLDLNCFMWGHRNPSVQTEHILSVFDAFQGGFFPHLITLSLNFKGFQTCSITALKVLIDNLKEFPSLGRVSLNIGGWQESDLKIDAANLLDCKYLVAFEETNDLHFNYNINNYYSIRKKLKVRRNLAAALKLIKEMQFLVTTTDNSQNLSDKKETAVSSSESDTVAAVGETQQKVSSISLFDALRREIIDEMVTEFLF